jgi:hypothetical protein
MHASRVSKKSPPAGPNPQAHPEPRFGEGDHVDPPCRCIVAGQETGIIISIWAAGLMTELCQISVLHHHTMNRGEG